jgi:hypothetical protein
MDPYRKEVIPEEPFDIMKVKPKKPVVTVPGTLGEKFDRWLAEGWTCLNCIEENYLDGQKKALEILRGWDEFGGDAQDFRNQTEETLTPRRARKLSILERQHQQWLMYRR